MNRCTTFRLLVASWLMLSMPVLVGAQQPSTGLPPLGSFAGGPFDTVNLANLDVHFEIPVFSRPGRGIPFHYNLSYDSLIWVPVSSNGVTSWVPVNNWGWRAVTEAATGYVDYGYSSDVECDYSYGGVQYIGGYTDTWTNFVYHDPAGGLHPFSGSVTFWINLGGPHNHCHAAGYTNLNAIASDNSGYLLSVNVSSGSPVGTVNARGGLTIQVPPIPNPTGAGSVTDANGNTISISSSGAITDTLDSGGSHVLSVAGTPPSNMTYTYMPPSGTAVNVTVSYIQHWIKTCFNVANIQEYSSSTQIPLVDTITLADGTSYHFQYEATVANGTCTANGQSTGRLASVTLTTGGTISYTYSASSGCSNNSNCMMADGSPSNMTRTITAGTNIIDQPGTWTYSRAVQSGQNLPQTATTVIDAAGDETDFNFSGIFQTQQTTYNGNGSSKSELRDMFSCYNGNYTGCQTATVSPPQPPNGWYRADYEDFPNYFLNEYSYDQYGNLTTELDHDLTSGAPVRRKTIIAIDASLCTPTPPAKNICDHPSSVEVQDGSGNRYAYTSYTYDHDNNNTVYNGNLILITKWVSPSSSNLVWQYSYNTQSGGGGTLSTATDPKNITTSYSYTGSSCNGAFPTSVSVAGLPATQYQYNCTGGVVTLITDPNGAQTSTSYSDAHFWRPAYTIDPLGNKTTFSYYTNAYSSGYPGVESVLTSNNNPVVDNLSVVDSLGRLSLNQTYNPGQNNWDTIEHLYDSNGRVSYITLPFSGSAGQPAGSLPSTGYSYDGLNRKTEISTWDGHNKLSYTDFVYNQNDVKVTFSPAPAGSSYPTSRQYESDALGRLTSVCELLPSGGGSACNQNSPPGNGYMTTYSYDPLGDLMGVNQSGQTRSFTYDGLSRMLTESNPESGTTTYIYDMISGSYCAVTNPYTSQGDLVATNDANGNHVCYWYNDPLHRLTDVGNNHQSATSPVLRFRYDNSAGVNGAYPPGISPQYYYGRMVEAETDSGTTLTDEWFSYNARGDQTDSWESTPNSGGWYHVANNYAANGPVSTRNGYFGTGTTTPFSNSFAYSFDGEGRSNGLTDTTINKAIWSGTTYNSASQPNQVQFYSGDSESFSWDWRAPGRMILPGSMLSWTSNVGSKQQAGSLTWNPNGALRILQVSDSANTPNTQTCNYFYDDLGRLGGTDANGYTVDCGSTWSQTFSYDAFGNIKKSGSSSFQPNYNANNQVSNLGFTYDLNGNIKNDGTNAYTYSVYNRPVTAGGNSATYDAFKRLVEVNGNTQLVYSPDGLKFAYMNGQTVNKYILPLGAGAQTVYTAVTSAAPAYWRHSDWLGSVRMTSSPGQTTLADQAYAPFGESYATYFHGGSNDFTGQTQDVSSGIYDFVFRQYSPVQGRWLTPDPSGLEAVDSSNPQSWNRYAYLDNNPLNAVDPLGLYCPVIETDIAVGGEPGCAFGIFFDIGVWDVFGGSTASGPPSPPPPPPSQPPPPPPSSVNFGDESLGIPSNLQHPWGIWSATIPTAECGDITCSPIGLGFLELQAPGNGDGWWNRFKQWLSDKYPDTGRSRMPR